MARNNYKNVKGRESKRDEALRRNAAFAYYGMPNRVAVPKQRAAAKPSGRKPESEVNKEITDAFKLHPYVRLWRNNRGVAIFGQQKVRYGVGPNGASDYIGYRRLTITPAMVGTDIAQFVALESKAPGEKPDEDQQAFITRVNADGGCAGWADSGEVAVAVLNK